MNQWYFTATLNYLNQGKSGYKRCTTTMGAKRVTCLDSTGLMDIHQDSKRERWADQTDGSPSHTQVLWLQTALFRLRPPLSPFHTHSWQRHAAAEEHAAGHMLFLLCAHSNSSGLLPAPFIRNLHRHQQSESSNKIQHFKAYVNENSVFLHVLVEFFKDIKKLAWICVSSFK